MKSHKVLSNRGVIQVIVKRNSIHIFCKDNWVAINFKIKDMYTKMTFPLNCQNVTCITELKKKKKNVLQNSVLISNFRRQICK